MATDLPIERKRGDTRRHTFRVVDKKGQVIDISTWTAFSMAVNTEKNPVDNTNEVDLITGILTTGGTDGRVGFPPGESVAPGSYFYDAQALDSNGEKVTFAEGKYKITQDIDKS